MAPKKGMKNKFYPVAFKLSARQRLSLRNYCKAVGTTPIKLIKATLNEPINSYATNKGITSEEHKNQLNLFDERQRQQELLFPLAEPKQKE